MDAFYVHGSGGLGAGGSVATNDVNENDINNLGAVRLIFYSG